METTGTTSALARNAGARIEGQDEYSRFPRHRDAWPRSDALVETMLRLPRSVDAPRMARKCVQRQSGEQLRRSERELVEILMTELVTNAVTHPPADAGGSVNVHFSVTPDLVRVAVHDPGEGFREADLNRPRSQPGGYGLIMVDRGSSRWGSTRDDGNCVWFELDRVGTA